MRFVNPSQFQKIITWLSIAVLCFLIFGPSSVQAAPARINAVLFYSPSCNHCHKVITQDLPPLIEKYGEQLNLIGIDVSTREGQLLFQIVLEYFKIPSGQVVVPFLVVGDTYLIGSVEIPERLPGIIERGLSTGGIDWPEIPELIQVLSGDESSGEQTNMTGSLSMWEAFLLDPAANSLSVIMLVILAASLLRAGYVVLRSNPSSKVLPMSWIVLALSIGGMVIAAYLAFVETTQTEAVCGPVGDCNAVQQSQYARLFGILPIGLLGLVGYSLLAAIWILQVYAPVQLRPPITLFFWVFSGLGVLFSTYLTFLEPFVIGATCAWCLTSALVMAALFWMTTSPALQAWQTIQDGRQKPGQDRTFASGS